MKGSKGSADPLWNFYWVLRCCWCQGLIGIGGLVSGVAGIVYQGLKKQLLFHGGNKHLSSIEILISLHLCVKNTAKKDINV